MDPEIPGDGWGCQEYDLCNEQQHGELEDSIAIGMALGKVDIRRGIFQGDYCL